MLRTLCVMSLGALTACGQILPGESGNGPDRPSSGRVNVGDFISGGGGADTVGHDPVSAAGDSQRGKSSVSIERRKKATNFKDRSTIGDQRDGDKKLKIPAPTQLGGGEAPQAATKAAKGDDRRGGRAATLLSGTEGIRDKLGRSGRGAASRGFG